MRDYYNRRVGEGGVPPTLALSEVSQQVGAAFSRLESLGYLQRSFGYECVDAKYVCGERGCTLSMQFLIDAGIRMEGDSATFVERANEVALFTFIEFAFDHMAKPDPRSGRFHDWSSCGWHFDHERARFDVAAGQSEWRDSVNRCLKLYGEGFELSPNGDVVRLAPHGLDALVLASVHPQAGEANVEKLNHAIRTFRLGRSTREQRKDAVRALVDLLEFYRPEVEKRMWTKDASALFSIANNFAIRHHNQTQKDDYDDAWLNWLFYLYLSTVRLMLDLVHGPTVLAIAPAKAPESEGDEFPF